jgi:hypothetical protein
VLAGMNGKAGAKFEVLTSHPAAAFSGTQVKLAHRMVQPSPPVIWRIRL